MAKAMLRPARSGRRSAVVDVRAGSRGVGVDPLRGREAGVRDAPRPPRRPAATVGGGAVTSRRAANPACAGAGCRTRAGELAATVVVAGGYAAAAVSAGSSDRRVVPAAVALPPSSAFDPHRPVPAFDRAVPLRLVAADGWGGCVCRTPQFRGALVGRHPRIRALLLTGGKMGCRTVAASTQTRI